MTQRNRLRSILTIAYMNGIVPMRTQPLFLVNTIVSPLSFLFFVYVASRGTLLPYAVSGGLILTMLSIGTSVQTDMTHYRVDLKLQDLVVASPVEGPVYIAGLALSELCYSIPGVTLLAVLWVGTAGSISLLGALTLFVVLLMVWAFATALGFTLATYFADVRETFILSSLTSLVLTVLPPVYYPVSYIPSGLLHNLAFIAPTTDAADLVRSTGSFAGVTGYVPPSTGQLAIDWSVLIIATVGLFLLAAFKARWREP